MDKMDRTLISKSNDKVSRRFWMLLLTIALFGLLFYLSESIAYLNDGRRLPMLDSEYWYLFAATLFLEIIYVFSALRFYHVKIKPFFLVLFSLLFIAGLVAAVYNPGISIEGGHSYLPTFSERARSIATSGAVSIGLYLVFAVMPEVLRGRFLFKGFCVIFVIVVFLAILYSLDKDKEFYAFLFDNGYFEGPYKVPQSWTTNRNVYAMMIFMGMLCECYLHEQHPHWWRWIIILFFAANQFFILSKTVIFVTAFFLPTYYLYRIIRVFKKHKVRDILTVLGVIALLIAIAVLYFTGIIDRYAFKLARLFGSFATMINSTANNSFQVRIDIWMKGFNALSADNVWLAFGWGEYLWQGCLNAVFKTSFEPCDSSYFTTIFQYGFLGLAVYLCMIGYIAFQIILLIKHRHFSGYFFLIYLIAYLAFSVTESHVLVNFSSQGSMVFTTMVLPVLVINNNDKHRSLIDHELDRKETKETPIVRSNVYPLDVYQNVLIKTTFPFAAVTTLLFAFGKAFSFFAYRPSVLAICAFSLFYLVLPFYISALHAFIRLGRSRVAWWSGLLFFGAFMTLLAGFFLHPAGFYAFFGFVLLSLIEIRLFGGYPPLKAAFHRSGLMWLAYFLSLALTVFTTAFVSPFTPQMLYSLLAFDLLIYLFVLLCRRHIDSTDWYYLSRLDEIEKAYSRLDRWIDQHDLTSFV
jgi:hypothetical protein